MAKPWEPIPGCEAMVWRAADGSAPITFNTRLGTTGRFMPPVAISTVPVPVANGSRFTGAYHLERLVAVPVVLPGVMTDRTTLRQWAAALDPAKGLGTLYVFRGPGAPFNRELEAIYETGMEDWEEEAPNIGVTTLVFRCPDPYWKLAADHSATASGGGAVRKWFPFLPMILGSTAVAATFTANNIGDVPAYPVVTVLGPATGPIRVSDDTTGQWWEYTGSLAAGQTLTVDHRPGHQAVTVDGANAFASLTPDSRLFSMPKGYNVVSMSASGTTSATKLTFRWRARYLSP